ncbi:MULTISPECIES: hypothetical protein [unclassified Treponema]|nr:MULTISPECIES: hypothetical protein [unclassified Treponema]
MPDGFQEIIGYKEVVTKEDTKIVDNIVDLYPDFVPFKVYSWQLKRIKK